MRQSKSVKRVVRTYKTKNGMVTKTYEYNPKKLKSRKKYVINSKGGVSKAAIKRLVEKGVGTEIQIKAKIAERLGLGNVSVSEERLEASILHNRIEGMFANAGVSMDYAADEVGATIEQLYDQGNWSDGVFTNPDTGVSYEFRFNYSGSVWEEIGA